MGTRLREKTPKLANFADDFADLLSLVWLWASQIR